MLVCMLTGVICDTVWIPNVISKTFITCATHLSTYYIIIIIIIIIIITIIIIAIIIIIIITIIIIIPITP